MARPLAYFISWTTYGIWLHGDERGWVEEGTSGIQAPDAERWAEARRHMTESPVTLDEAQRAVVAATIQAHCAVRGWTLHVVNPRTNHVHVVVTADNVPPETVMDQFKAWCSRRLNERGPRRKTWWTRHGSTKWINDEEYYRNAVNYVMNRQ